MSKRKLSTLMTLLLLCIGALYAALQPVVPLEATPGAVSAAATSTRFVAEAPWYVVQRVVDGDTVVLVMGGEEVTIRLLGIDTPEVVAPNRPVQCFGPEASAKAKVTLEGKMVRFEVDDSQGVYDKYHRRLGYIYLEDGTDFEKMMIEQGFGREYTYKKPYAHQIDYKEAQAKAKEYGLGLWSACAHA